MRVAIFTSVLLLLTSCGGSTPPAEEPTPSPPVAEPEAAPSGPPVAEVRPVTNTYHGVDVVDRYQWLEDPQNPEVRAWSDAQNAWARQHLDALPGREAIGARVRAILSSAVRSHHDVTPAGDRFFALESRPPREQPFIVVLSSLDDPDGARVLVDPTTIDESGAVAIDWFVPSPDGTKLAVSLSRGGSERGDVHVYDVESGSEIGEVIERVHGGTAGGDLAWLPDGSGFFYTRYPRAGERPAEDESFYQQLYFHQLGTPVAQDRFELGTDFPRIAEIQLQMHAASGRMLAAVQRGDGGEFAQYLRERDGRWRQFADFDDGIVQVSFGTADDLYVVSRAGAPRGKILRVPIRTLDVARARVIVPEGEDSIVTEFWGLPMLVATRTRLIVAYQLGGPSELRIFNLQGRRQAPLSAPPPVSAIRALVPLEGENVLYRLESFVQPAAWYRLEASRGGTEVTALRETSPVDTSNWEVRRELATSRDGTRVPLNIVMPRGIALDGSHPCVVNGYGGYGVNIEPRFRPMNDLYVGSGVIYVVANLRGGAEFGEAWHEAGALTHKQNVFDDFVAVLNFLTGSAASDGMPTPAEARSAGAGAGSPSRSGATHVNENRYTSRERLAIIGGSNGGLLMGATMTQHPELVRAVVSFVGIYDMLRVELSPNGAFNVTEFGTVADEAQFRALHAYSPYHHVEDGTRYPATLFLTGANDPRVEPWHSRKMTARLQAATSGTGQGGGAPILLRTSDTSGHGMGTALSEEIAELTDVLSFLFAQLGVAPPA